MVNSDNFMNGDSLIVGEPLEYELNVIYSAQKEDRSAYIELATSDGGKYYWLSVGSENSGFEYTGAFRFSRIDLIHFHNCLSGELTRTERFHPDADLSLNIPYRKRNEYDNVKNFIEIRMSDDGDYWTTVSEETHVPNVTLNGEKHINIGGGNYLSTRKELMEMYLSIGEELMKGGDINE